MALRRLSFRSSSKRALNSSSSSNNLNPNLLHGSHAVANERPHTADVSRSASPLSRPTSAVSAQFLDAALLPARPFSPSASQVVRNAFHRFGKTFQRKVLGKQRRREFEHVLLVLTRTHVLVVPVGSDEVSECFDRTSLAGMRSSSNGRTLTLDFGQNVLMIATRDEDLAVRMLLFNDLVRHERRSIHTVCAFDGEKGSNNNNNNSNNNQHKHQRNNNSNDNEDRGNVVSSKLHSAGIRSSHSLSHSRGRGRSERTPHVQQHKRHMRHRGIRVDVYSDGESSDAATTTTTTTTTHCCI